MYTYVPNTTIEIVKDSIISRVLYKDEALNVTLFGFDTGQGLTKHTASQPAIIQILSGEAALVVNEETKEVQAGMWLHMIAGLTHSILAKTPLVMLLTLVNTTSS
jgi:quercetin dioxygenase-like cupin family protein